MAPNSKILNTHKFMVILEPNKLGNADIVRAQFVIRQFASQYCTVSYADIVSLDHVRSNELPRLSIPQLATRRHCDADHVLYDHSQNCSLFYTILLLYCLIIVHAWWRNRCSSMTSVRLVYRCMIPQIKPSKRAESSRKLHCGAGGSADSLCNYQCLRCWSSG